MLSVQFAGTRHIHMAVQPPPPSVSGTVSSSPPETLSPGNTDSPASPPHLLQPPLYLLLLSSTPPGTSYARTHTAFVLLCLACFTEHRGLWPHPCHRRCRNFLPFKGSVIFRCMARPCSAYWFIHQWMLALFLPFSSCE